jgi:predicted Zn-dependent peptidase
MTIGKELSHIEKATLSQVKSFFFKHYTPCNAILVVAGAVDTTRVRSLAEKWFGDITSGTVYNRSLATEPKQTAARHLTIEASVPLDMLCKTWHMGARQDSSYHATDLLTDILGGGASSRLYHTLVKEQQLFSSIDCYHFASSDPGLLTIEGKLIKGVSIEKAEQALTGQLQKVMDDLIGENELQKVKNKTESMIAFEDMSVMSRAASLAYYELLGDAAEMNSELGKYEAVTAAAIREQARTIFREENSNTLYYMASS